MKKWNIQEFNKAIQLLRQGLNYKDIGKKLQCTDRAVKSKLEKSGYKYSDYHNYKETRICEICKSGFEVNYSSPKKFCSHSCSAKKSNVERAKPKKKCLQCDKKCSRHAVKYCSNKCQFEYESKAIMNKIENGDTKQSHKMYKRYLILKHGEKCMECGWSEVNPFSNKVPIELEHIDGNSSNNKLSNLKLLCPNHHALTATYKALNKGNGRHNRKLRYQEGKSY